MSELTKRPKEKVPMTEREMAAEESSISPICPTNILVNELVPYRHNKLNTTGPAIFHIFTVSVQSTDLASFKFFTGA